MTDVLVAASFDDLRSRHVRQLHEASRHGPVHVLLYSDALFESAAGRPSKFPLDERKYFLESLKVVDRVTPIDAVAAGIAAAAAEATDVVGALAGTADDARVEAAFRQHNVACRAIPDEQLAGFPIDGALQSSAATANENRPKVIVTGCYDWFHSGHIRFFEEAAAVGELHVVVGHDANIELLKGAGHPMYREDERRYMVAAVRFVHAAYVSTGHGWLDAEPEIAQIKPDIYVVNEDGDKPEKREFCASHGIEYRVLTRRPKAGLPTRQSTDLRGF
ncbi:MAG: adenylyltransferase/cytidyltransferase family protein [Planctomycetales bacterium]|nr:adenylyltransferase/cytidyltransferase family protein [Planctomycetales bacterium]